MPEFTIRAVDVYVYRVVTAHPEFLLLRRSESVVYAGQWRMVGGKIKAGEPAWQAALRELQEETRIAPQQFWAVPSVNTFYEWQKDRVNIVPAFAAEVTHDPILNHEHDAFCWLPIHEALAKVLWHEQKRLLQLVHEIVSEARILPDWLIDAR